MDDTQGAKNTEKMPLIVHCWKITISSICLEIIEVIFNHILSVAQIQNSFFKVAIIGEQKKVFPFQFFRMFKCFEARVVVGHCPLKPPVNDLPQNLLRPQPHLC